jgi:hypothetical protein
MIRYFNFPAVPIEILNNLNYQFDQYNAKVSYRNKTYVWSDDFNQEINNWCQKNICETMHWGFQIMSNRIETHKDVGTEIKLIYLIRSGGANVKTNFYKDDKITVSHSYVIPTFRWHILKANEYHSVDGIEPGNIRFSLTGRVFP